MPRELKGRPVGIPENVRVVRPAPDDEPVEFNWNPVVYASWLTPELMRETEETYP